MSDVERITQRNWEQSRHAEEYAAFCKEAERERMDQQVIRIVNGGRAAAASCNGKVRYRNKGWKIGAARVAGRIALGLSAASGLMGMELLFPAFLLVAVVFYTLHFEFQKGRSKVWHKIW